MQNIDSLLLPSWVVPVIPNNVFYKDYAVAIDKGRIVDVLLAEKAKEKYQAASVVSLPEHVLMPGLVNAHTHSPMTLLRGVADDLPFMTWLFDYILPLEDKWGDEEFVRDGMEFALAEMLLSGTTCFHEQYFLPQVMTDVVVNANARACIGMVVVSLKSKWANDVEDYIAKHLQFYKKYQNAPLIKINFAPHAPYSVDDKTLLTLKKLAKEMNLTIQMHVHESEAEITESLEKFGKRPLKRLHDLGMFEVPFLAVHMVQLNDEDLALLKKNPNVNVLHCPKSNLKIGNGICPISKILKQGTNVAIGTDGAASNNVLDMFEEMRFAALLAKGDSRDPTTVSAALALQMATINGARALGLDKEIGSIEIGKAADLITVDLSFYNTQPVTNPISHLVYAVNSRQVSDVWIAGKRIVQNRALTTLDREKMLAKAKRWSEKISADLPH